jgi:flagellar protein FliS
VPLSNPYNQYRQTAATTADRGQLLVMTYEALLRWLARADSAIDDGKVPTAHNALVNAQELVQNLTWALDYDRGGEIAVNLSRVYNYLGERLVWANVNKDKSIIDEVRQLVEPLVDAWRVAVDQARKEGQIPTLV